MPKCLAVWKKMPTFAPAKQDATNMVPVVQLVRMSDCGSEGRRFEPVQAPRVK